MKWSSVIIKRILNGTVLFLLPVMLLLIIIKKAAVLVRGIIQPLTAHLPDDMFFGIGMLTLLTFLVIVSICYIAGVWAEKKGFNTFLPFLENNILVLIPGYSLLKSRAEEVVGDSENKWKAVLVGEEGDWKFALEVEKHEDGYSTVFFPEPPDAKSGEVKLIHSSNLKHLNIPASNLINITRKYGHGSGFLTDQLKK